MKDRPPEFDIENHPAPQTIENTGELLWLGGWDSNRVIGPTAAWVEVVGRPASSEDALGDFRQWVVKFRKGGSAACL